MKIHTILKTILLILPLFFFSCNKQAVIIEEVEYKGKPHFKIQTENANWYLEKQSGGFSSIMDKDSVDWVQYRKSDSISVPESAASDFRGLPNLVHGGEQSGIGHPGFEKCTSKLQGSSTILTESNDGRYAFTWTFNGDYAEFNLLKADSSREYWFLYEGTIGGHFSPSDHICITNEGLQEEKPAISIGNYIRGNFEWIAFGDRGSSNLFYIHHLTPDEHEDVIMYMGATRGLHNDSPDGMVVTGFGRSVNHKPLMSEAPNTFRVGFLDAAEISESDYFDFLNEFLGR